MSSLGSLIQLRFGKYAESHLTMNHLCIRDLTEIVGGRLRLGCLPPLGGELEPLGPVVVDCSRVKHGDTYWELAETGGPSRADEAFARGALGVVVSGRAVEPWAGKFSLEVEDARAALGLLSQTARRPLSEKVRGCLNSATKQLRRICSRPCE